MDADDMTVGQDYAHLASHSSPQDPVRATLIEEPVAGEAKVELNHPDVGRSEATVATRSLVGGWLDEVDTKRFPAYRAQAQQAGTLTWSDVAATLLANVRRQRALAQRLSNLGVPRRPAHYAGEGGSSAISNDVKLQLNYDELERLVDYAEVGRRNGAQSGSW